MNGTVKFFNRMKGFGFIAGEDGKEYFVHKTDLNAGVIIADNDAVTFDVTEGDKGPKAANVSLGSADDAAPAEEAAEAVSEDAPAEEATEEAAEEAEDAPAEEATEEATEEAAEEAEDAPAEEATEEETPDAE